MYTKPTNEERSVIPQMLDKFTGVDIDDMIFGTSETVVSER